MKENYYPIVIAGAGESGIALACQLKKKLGFNQFKIFDRQGGIGGTWYINKYPGVACDIPALFYSFSFAPNYKWTSFFPPGSEILKYLRTVCQRFEIMDNIQLNTEVSEARWLETEEEWEITLTHLSANAGDLSELSRQARVKENGEGSIYLRREVVRAKILVSCVGGLVEPKAWPTEIPGIENFQGQTFHSARWECNADLRDKNVVVVGTGCSAAQLVPCLTKAPFNAKSVTQLMKSPPWVFPRPPTPEIWRKYSPRILGTVPGLGRLLRFLLFLSAELNWLLFGLSESSARRREKFQNRLLKHLQKTVPEKYRQVLIPDYGVGCKRIIIDDQWFKCLSQPNVELTPRPMISVQARSITLGPEPRISEHLEHGNISNTSNDTVEKPADVIILANGYDTASYLHRMKVHGAGGKLLQEIWDERGGPQAYLGTAVDKFPNFFMILGPNTLSGHSSAILASENAVSYILNFITPILKGDVATAQIKKEALVTYTTDVQERSKRKIWSGCQSWYKTASGWNSSVCPYSQIHFTMKCMFPRWSDWDIKYTAQGLRKQRVRRYLAFALAFTVITGILLFVKSRLPYIN